MARAHSGSVTLEVFEDKAGKYRWHKQDANGEITSDSGQGYDRSGIIQAVQRETNEAGVGNVVWPEGFFDGESENGD